jgi:hypothetical protein
MQNAKCRRKPSVRFAFAYFRILNLNFEFRISSQVLRLHGPTTVFPDDSRHHAHDEGDERCDARPRPGCRASAGRNDRIGAAPPDSRRVLTSPALAALG